MTSLFLSTFLLQIFGQLCFCLKDVIKTVRLVVRIKEARAPEHPFMPTAAQNVNQNTTSNLCKMESWNRVLARILKLGA